MTYFYFNDCLPYGRSKEEYRSALEQTLQAYSTLSKDYRVGIVMEKTAGGIALADHFTLVDCIKMLSREYRTYAFSVLNKYPVDLIKQEPKERVDYDAIDEQVIKENFSICIDEETRDATNLALASLWGAMLFTLGLGNELRQNQLKLCGQEDDVAADNLYGEQSNTEYINMRLSELHYQSLSFWDKIKSLVGGTLLVCDDVRDTINALPQDMQDAILTRFEEAGKQQLLCPVKRDKKIIKMCIPARERDKKKDLICELRIKSPVAFRIYFREVPGGIQIVYVGDKAHNQEKDIRTAYDRI